jgi:hypothetical protein
MIKPKFKATAQTEAMSRAMFLTHFSNDFIINEINQDFFGIDYLLTKYEGDTILPQIALAQLKATSIAGKDFIDIRIRDLQFWSELDIPVYLVLINVPDNLIKIVKTREIEFNPNNLTTRINF